MTGTANITGALPTFKQDGVTPFAASDCLGINIYRASGTGAPVMVGKATISAGSFSFADTGLAPGSYNWGATALNAAGEGALSGLVPGVVPLPPEVPGAPTIIKVVIS
jgi:hypothetical protein